MMKKKGMGTVISMLLTAAMLLGGCGSAAGAQTPAEETKKETVQQEVKESAAEEKAEKTDGEVVELTMFGFKTGAEQGALPELIEQFNNENPGIHVTYEGISNSGGYQDVLTSRLASGQGDDIFMAQAYLGQLQEAGYVKDLSGVSTVADYTELVQDLMTIDGQISGLGMEIAVFGMFVNMDLLKECGIEKAPANYQEFLDACKAVTDAGHTAIACSGKDGTGLAVFAATRGLYPLYQDAEKAAKIEQINTGELSFGSYMKDGFILLKDLIDKGYINPEKALVTEAAKDDIAEFVKEDTAFMPGGSWFVSSINEGAPDMNYILTGVPVMDDDSLIMINAGVKLCINSKTEHSAEAEKFIEFMTGKESLDKYVQSQNSFSPLKDGSSTSNAVVDPVAEYLTSGRMISWVDPSFKSPVEPWTIARSYASNIAAGADIDTTVKDMDTDLTNKIKLK